jgi:hypothetical protein
MLYVIHVYQHLPANSRASASPEGCFRLQFAQCRVALLDFAPILVAFASRFVISTPPRFARDYSAHARLVISVETPGVRAADAEHDEGACRKPFLHVIRDSRIATVANNSPADASLEGFSIAIRARPRGTARSCSPLAAFAWRSVISTPPRFARDYSAHARLIISVETPRLRTGGIVM